tara:strand:- start:2686 stop:4452 length:1767 start_codon:yes stop_codon:yes gene_type:complete
MNNPYRLGTVSSVSSSSVSVDLADSIESGILIIGGKNYRVGQVGSFVKIPLGYNQLYGVISESSESSHMDLEEKLQSARKWIKVELVGELIGGVFDRGISEHPSVGDEVHIVVDNDLRRIFSDSDGNQVAIGKLSSSDSIDVGIDLDKLVTRHSAVLGSTGSGKSTSVASILRSIVMKEENVNLPSARILMIDIHGEYKNALGDIAKTFSVIPDDENPLYVPYWCLSPEYLIEFICGSLSESQKTNFFDKAIEEKLLGIKENNIKGLRDEQVTSVTPLPYRLKKIWYDLYHEDTVNWEDTGMTVPAYISEGDYRTLTPPKFRPPGAGTSLPKKGGAGVMKRQLDLMKSRMLDAQYSFLLNPGAWSPDSDGKVEKDLNMLIDEWLGHNKPITILDLSGMPSSRLSLLLGAILDVLFEASVWGRNLSAGMKSNPLLIVLEEAHRYLSKSDSGLSKQMVQRIAKEGRKFGVGAMIVSQRPSEIDETILSQCGTIISLRINNATDRSIVKAAMSEGLAGIVDVLPVLRTGEAIIVGEAAKLPTRCRINLLPLDKYPNSQDPDVLHNWSKPSQAHDFSRLVLAWRLQNNLKEE